MRALRSPTLHAVLLFVLNLAVARPYLYLAYSAHPWGNDFSYLSIARLFREQAWTWNALQYCGAPFRYLYPPLFPSVVALLPLDAGRAFHIVGALSYALVPVALHRLTLRLGQSRTAALFAGVCYSLLASPLYLFLPAWRMDAQPLGFAPVGLIGLTRFDEAPHFLAFALGLFAIAAAWDNRTRLACVLGAGVLLTNIPGAIGYFLMLSAFGLAHRTPRVAGGLGALSFGLSAFWLTPGYGAAVALTDRVLLSSRADSYHWSWAASLIALTGAAAAILILLMNRNPACRFAVLWVCLTGVVFTVFTATGISLLPLANRYALEWNAALVVGFTLLLFSIPTRYRTAAAVAVFLVGAWITRGFLLHPWRAQAQAGDPRGMVSFQAADWLRSNAPTARVFAAGDVENSLNAFQAVPQTGGSFTGMSNLLAVAAANRLQGACEPFPAERALAELWLRALDVRFAVVNEAASPEAYHWMAHPAVFAGDETAWDDHRGDRIVRIPQNGGSAVVVDLRALDRLPPFTSISGASFLEAYTAWARGLRDAAFTWTAAGEGVLRSTLGPGEGLLIKSSYDPGWRSSLGRVEPDPIGFLLIRPANPQLPGATLRFGFSADVWLGILIAVASALALPRARLWPWVGGAIGLAWLAAFLFLLHRQQPLARIAFSEFQSNRLPLISFNGIVTQGRSAAGNPIYTIYGVNFGDARARVRVFVGDREARVITHAANVVHIEVNAPIAPEPQTAIPAPVAIEVNGCRGNSFLLR